MTTAQQRALVSLLQDSDSATVGLVRDQLLEGGPDRVPEYLALLKEARGAARASLAAVIEQLETSKILGDISRGLAGLRTWKHLEAVCWDLARAEQHSLDGGPYARQLDDWAAEVGRLIRPHATAAEKVACLAGFLGGRQGLAGNTHDYYQQRNGHLPWVMEFRQGLPITVTLVYILVGARIGLEVQGVGAPGHFLARIGDVVFDPYHSGRILSEGEWELIASEVPFRQRSLLERPCAPQQLMHRLLINLRNCCLKQNDGPGATMIDHYLAVLQK
jgi:hypothetical protein